MWQYTTETIINSNDGHLQGGARIYNDGKTLLIEGVGSFEIAKIQNAWKRPYQKAIQATATITIPEALPEDAAYRLQLLVSEEGTIRPELQNAMLKKVIPFSYEVLGQKDDGKKTSGAALADKLAAVIKKDLSKRSGAKLFTVAHTEGTRVITITATDCYVQFGEGSSLVRVLPDTDTLNGYMNHTSVAGASVAVTAGTEGNGTVARLIKNLRLPTRASMDPFGSYHGGKPVPGGEYDQYMFEYVVDRSHMGHQVFGSVADKSMTTHVFFVKKDLNFAELTGVTFASYEPTTFATGEAKADFVGTKPTEAGKTAGAKH